MGIKQSKKSVDINTTPAAADAVVAVDTNGVKDSVIVDKVEDKIQTTNGDAVKTETEKEEEKKEEKKEGEEVKAEEDKAEEAAAAKEGDEADKTTGELFINV
jgi:hypothetical protein